MTQEQEDIIKLGHDSCQAENLAEVINDYKELLNRHKRLMEILELEF